MSDKPYTVEDLAARWGCDTDYVFEMIEAGRLRAFTIGTKRRRGSYRITREAEIAFLNPPAPDEHFEPVLKGYVYFVGHGPFLKIGFTSGSDWRRRMKGIQTHSPHELTVWRVFVADSLAETMLHNALEKYRVRGEWFALGESGKAEALALMAGFITAFEGNEPI